MMLPTIGPWQAVHAAQATDKRVMFTRDRGTIHYNVRVWRAVVARRVGRFQQYERCPHGHRKPGAAKKCAEAAARRWNRLAHKVRIEGDDG